MNSFRSHYCSDLSSENVGESVRLSGWVHRVRDHGGILFIDLRDHYGITQILADPDSPVFNLVEKVKSEWCIRIDGLVKLRDESLVNKKIPTGYIEVFISDIEVLGPSEELPLIVFGDQEYPEETRLKYRFLDLRREKLQRNMKLRSDVVSSIRKRMWDIGFREFQTPIFTASSPEGARDFLVPCRLHPGKFYALPQAPQQFKQLLMVSGFDKYFQIAPCFRDEDPRSDRSPTDFYQLDIEMSFVDQEDVFSTVQPVIQNVFEEFGGEKQVDTSWEKIPYKTSMKLYGTDKPDLRNPLKMQDVSQHFFDSGFEIFSKILRQEGTEIRAIPAPSGGSRKFCDRMNAFAQKEGLPGMGYIFWREMDGVIDAAGPIAKNIGKERTEAIRKQLNLTNHNRFAFAWIVDFPMYEKDESSGEIDFSHNPFSMPQGGIEALNDNPLEVLGYQYDLTCNGYELLSGAIRNHKLDVMIKAFELAGYGEDEVRQRFGGMVNAFSYGAPPHGGCAAGIDRIVMLLAEETSIREVILFPMNQRAEDLMMSAPSIPTSDQMMELNLRRIDST